MSNQVFNYLVTPSVVRADEETEITVRPLGENVAFKRGLEYTLEIRERDALCARWDEFPTAKYAAVPDEAGELKFTHRFRGEQRHTIILRRPPEDVRSPYYEINNHRNRRPDNVDAVLAVYSLAPDLYGLRCFKGETHCHTYESDGVQDAVHTVGNYRAAGYDFLALTDHFTSYASEKAKRVFASAPVAMTLLLGEEVHVPTERIHTIRIGGEKSVNEWFRAHKAEAEADVAALAPTLALPDGVDREDYAWRVWIADKSRELGGIAILAHPFWIWEEVYFIPPAVTRQLLRDGVYDALDLRDYDMEPAVALWEEMRAEGVRIPVVGSTDSHRTDAANPKLPAPGGYTFAFAPDRSEAALLNAIRAGNSLCVRADGASEFVFGSFRLTKFARFLLDKFYPVYMRLCHGQGTLMADWPVDGAPDAEAEALLDGLNKRSEKFARDFYGY